MGEDAAALREPLSPQGLGAWRLRPPGRGRVRVPGARGPALAPGLPGDGRRLPRSQVRPHTARFGRRVAAEPGHAHPGLLRNAPQDLRLLEPRRGPRGLPGVLRAAPARSAGFLRRHRPADGAVLGGRRCVAPVVRPPRRTRSRRALPAFQPGGVGTAPAARRRLGRSGAWCARSVGRRGCRRAVGAGPFPRRGCRAGRELAPGPTGGRSRRPRIEGRPVGRGHDEGCPGPRRRGPGLKEKLRPAASSPWGGSRRASDRREGSRGRAWAAPEGVDEVMVS